MRRQLAAGFAIAALGLGLLGVRSLAAAPAATATPDGSSQPRLPRARARAEGRKLAPRKPCPPDMVSVRGNYCVDRFEAALLDPKTRTLASPYYSANPLLAQRDAAHWEKQRKRTGPHPMRDLALPPLPSAQTSQSFAPMAVSRAGVLPAAYVDLSVARKACAAASKRLCAHTEWLRACRGNAATRQPYGDKYAPGRCNVSRGLHPASVLHSPGEFGGTDPRLNTILDHGFDLLLRTGSLQDCASRWGQDAIFDMVGNLDEWIDDPRGTFLGGFYARDMPWGCDARIDIHSADYYDYSTGFRCCKDAAR